MLDLPNTHAAEVEILNEVALQKTATTQPSNTLKGALFQEPISLRLERDRIFYGQ